MVLCTFFLQVLGRVKNEVNRLIVNSRPGNKRAIFFGQFGEGWSGHPVMFFWKARRMRACIILSSVMLKTMKSC